MTLDLTERYPGQVVASDPAYPLGKARNRISPADGTGTPFERDWLNDLHGAHQAILDAAGITASGDPDKVGASDVVDSLNTLYRDPILSVGWQLGSRVSPAISYPVGGQLSTARSLCYASDGTRLFVVGDAAVYQYALPTPWNLAGASYQSLSLDVSDEDGTPTDVAISSDGGRLFVLGSANDRIYTYNLPTPNSLDGAFYPGYPFDVSGTVTDAHSLCWSPDGTKCYVLGAFDQYIWQFTAGAPWDVTSLSYASKNLSSGIQSAAMKYVRISEDGRTLVASSNAGVWAYTLSTPFDLATATYNSQTTAIASLLGTAFSPKGAQMLAINGTTVSQHHISRLVLGVGA